MNVSDIRSITPIIKETANLTGNISTKILQTSYNVSEGAKDSLIRLDECAYLCQNGIKVMYNNPVIMLLFGLFISLGVCYFLVEHELRHYVLTMLILCGALALYVVLL